MPLIPDSFKQELLHRIDITELIGRYVPLRKGGSNLLACCPFHSEKTPSFTVSPSKQFYHCFGCGAHGNAISFLMEYQGMGYVEAVKELADSLGMKMPDFDRSVSGQGGGPDLAEVLERAARYYREQLRQSPAAIEYLKGRGLTGKTAARFGIGYAPAGWQNLRAVYTDYEDKNLKDAGLVIEAEGGRRYDRFRDRILFPIQSQRGTVIGFGGRVLGAGEPKYLNSPETPLFEKGRELYGWPQARTAIRSKGRVLVVEGYMDVVALAQHGIEYAVATLGTATTPMHVQKLFRASDEIVFCFDGDAAGRRAAWHALEVALAELADDKVARFLFLPAEHDPDSFVRAHGAQAFEARLAESRPLSEYLLAELRGRVDLGTSEGRARLVAEAKPLLKRVVAPALQIQLVKQLSELAGMSVADTARLVDLKLSGARVPREPPTAKASRLPAEGRLERQILAYLIACPRLAEALPRELFDASRPRDRTVLAVADFIIENLGAQAGARDCGSLLLDHFASQPAHLQAIQEAQTWAVEVDFGADEAEAEFRPALEKRRLIMETERHTYLRTLVDNGSASAEQRQEFIALSTRARAAPAPSGNVLQDP